MTAILNISNDTDRRLTLSSGSSNIDIDSNQSAHIDLSKCACCQVFIKDQDDLLWKGYLPVPESIKLIFKAGELQVSSNDQVFPSLYRRCRWPTYVVYFLLILAFLSMIFLVFYFLR
jgi:hypothetical protein